MKDSVSRNSYRRIPGERVHIINLLIGDVFKDGVDEVYGPMAEFAEIPAPLYETVPLNGDATPPVREATEQEILSAKYLYFDDRGVSQEPTQEPGQP